MEWNVRTCNRLAAIAAAIYFVYFTHAQAPALAPSASPKDRFQRAGFMKTAVPRIYAIPGGTWDTASGSLGYYVPQGMGMRQVDTSHVSQSLAHRIQCLDAELRIPWGFLVHDDHGGVALIDVPYHSLDLAKRIKRVAPGKPLLIIFTHSDFLGVAEVDNWRNSFETVRIVAHDSDAIKGDVERLVGSGPWQVGDFQIHAAPGHTEGSLIVSSSSLSTSFGGDSAGVWEGKLTGFPEMARFSCKAQSLSLRRFADNAPFYRYWFPGHGLPMQFESRAERQKLLHLVADGLEQASQSGQVAAP